MEHRLTPLAVRPHPDGSMVNYLAKHARPGGKVVDALVSEAKAGRLLEPATTEDLAHHIEHRHGARAPIAAALARQLWRARRGWAQQRRLS